MTAFTSSSVGGKPTSTFFTLATYAEGDTASKGTGGGGVFVVLATSCLDEDEQARAPPNTAEAVSNAPAQRRERLEKPNICGTTLLLSPPTGSRCRARRQRKRKNHPFGETCVAKGTICARSPGSGTFPMRVSRPNSLAFGSMRYVPSSK